MTHTEGQQPPGWYYAHGDPPGTQRYWDGTSWVGAPQPVPGSELVESDLKTALPVPRVGARILDWLLWAVGLVVALVIFDGAGIAARTLTVIAVLGYEIGMVSAAGATLGKMTVGLKVVDEQGLPPDAAAAVRRAVPLAAVGVVWVAATFSIWMEAVAWPVFLAAVVAGFVMLFTGPERQAIWDRIAKTVVVAK